MKTAYDDFIGIYGDIAPAGYCAHMISEFERLRAGGAGANRQQSDNVPMHLKDDHHMFLETAMGASFAPFEGTPALQPFYKAIQDAFNDYTARFSVLQNDPISGHVAKMQRTAPGGGYHVWHGEQNRGFNASRVLTYMLYLNTLEPEEGGETEFLYQKRRIRPQENTMLVWPAAFTHAHRGNTVLGNQPKYIITGWFCFD